MQSLLLDIFGPILIESFSLEEIKLQNLPLECDKKLVFVITLRNQKMGGQTFYMLVRRDQTPEFAFGVR